MDLVQKTQKKIAKIKKLTIKDFLPSLVISLISISLVTLLHLLGTFDFLELKMYDFKYNLRGPLSATGKWNNWPVAEAPNPDGTFMDMGNGVWNSGEEFTDIGNGVWDEGEKFEDANKNGIWNEGEDFIDIGNGFWNEGEDFIDIGNGIRDEGLDVIIVYSDDESYKFLSEKFSYPYPRGEVWAKAIMNLAKSGAKVVVLDYMFDAPDLNTVKEANASKKIINNLPDEKYSKKDLEMDIALTDNDALLAKAILKAKELGTTVILAGRIEYDPDSTEPYSVLRPSETIYNTDLKDVDFGMVDIQQDKDGFLRRYPIYQKLSGTEKYNYSLAVEAVLAFYGENSDKLQPIYNPASRETKIGDFITIPTYEGKSSFLLNYYGPSSGALGASGTFTNKSLKYILDDYDLCFGNCYYNESIGKYVRIDSDGEKYVDANKNGKWDQAEEFVDTPDGTWNEGEEFKDLPNGEFDKGDIFIPDEDDDNDNGVWDKGEEYVDSNGNGWWDQGEEFTDSNGNGYFDEEEYFEDIVGNGIWDEGEEFIDIIGNGKYDEAEEFSDTNKNGKWDEGEKYIDRNSNGQYDEAEEFSDTNKNGKWDQAEDLIDLDENGVWTDGNIDDDDAIVEFFQKDGVNIPSPFKDKIVILGTSLLEEQDFKNVPLMSIPTGSIPMPGVDVHANAIQQLLHESYIQSSYRELNINSYNWFGHFSLIVLLVVITLLIVSNLGTYSSTFAMVSLVLIWFSYSVGCFVADQLWLFKTIFGTWEFVKPTLKASDIIPSIYPMVAIIVPYGLNLSYKLYTEGKNKKFLKDTFGTFVSPQLVDQMYETKQTPQLGGVDVYNTCFFSDIASFSSFSEKMTAPELVVLLNEYLEEMTNILLDNGGTLDKYIGDAIIAIFGSPIEVKDHEYRGALSICQMNEKLEELRHKWKSEGDKWPEVVHNMRHRIGLNTGQIVAGNMGSSVRMSYTMMGDAVNTTARLESGAKQYGIESQVGEQIYEATKDNFVYRHLDHVRVKGKKNPVKTFELISEKGKEPEVYKELLPLWDNAVSLYKKQKWDEAIKLFEDCDKLEEKYVGRPTNPSLFFIARCNEYKANPPGENWDGIYTLKTK